MKFFNDGGVSFFDKFVFPGKYLKANHFEKKLDMGGGLFKTAKG